MGSWDITDPTNPKLVWSYDVSPPVDRVLQRRDTRARSLGNMKELGFDIPKTNQSSHPLSKSQPTAIQINDVDIERVLR